MVEYNLDTIVPKRKLNQFHNKKIYTNLDLIDYIPVKYNDLRFTSSIFEATKNLKYNETLEASVIGKILKVSPIKNKGFFTLSCIDMNGDKFTVFYFNHTHLKNDFKVGSEWLFHGKVGLGKDNFPPTLIPEYQFDDIIGAKNIFPVYRKIPNMSDEYLKSIIDMVLDDENIKDNLDENIKKEFKLMDYDKAIKLIHKPRNSCDMLLAAYKRLTFEKLYSAAIHMNQTSVFKDFFSLDDKSSLNKFIEKIPFDLTKDQLSAISDASNIMSQSRLNALVQGDVGSGKTIVALALMSLCISNTSQACLVAPTETLAKQHLEDAINYFGKDNVSFLSGSLKQKDKKMNLEKIKRGCPIIIGTHSLLQEYIVFQNLATCIFDEQHRFGVRQREMLTNYESNGKFPHVVSLSATPIPRSLAISLYTDSMKVYDIKTKPNGRLPIITKIAQNDDEANLMMVREIELGHQAYIVCPLIESSKSDKIAHVKSVEDVYNTLIDDLSRINTNTDIKVEYISGDMKQELINEKIERFKNKDFHILISTTIIEVGVNVPNATIMLIKSSDRFGLATLHQLRGRVGRNSLQSYTILQPDNINDRKSQILVQENNGYNIAMLDLNNRGSGVLAGTEQSGHDGDFDFILRHMEFFKKIQYYINNKER